MRSAWDYAERWAEFLGWAERLAAVENPLSVLRFGVDKERYLSALAGGRACRSCRPSFVHPGEPFQAPGEPFVVKPAISAGGRRSARFEAGDERAAELVAEILDGRRRRRWSSRFVEGAAESLARLRRRRVFALAEPSRGASTRDGRRRCCTSRRSSGSYDASSSERRVAEAALALVPAPTLYARVDLLGGRRARARGRRAVALPLVRPVRRGQARGGRRLPSRTDLTAVGLPPCSVPDHVPAHFCLLSRCLALPVKCL